VGAALRHLGSRGKVPLRQVTPQPDLAKGASDSDVVHPPIIAGA